MKTQFRGLRWPAMAILAAATVAPLLTGVTQRASAACNPYRSNDYTYRWVGSTRSVPSASFGVLLRATINIYNPYVVVSSRSWIQIADSTHDKWVKSGYFDDAAGDGYPDPGVEWKDGYVSHYYFNSSDYSSHQITLNYGASSKTTSATIAGFGSYTTPAISAMNPNILQILGETFSHADQMPGGTSNKVLVSNAQYSYDSYPYAAFSGSAVNSDPYSTGYGLNGLSPTSLQYWDNKCP